MKRNAVNTIKVVVFLALFCMLFQGVSGVLVKADVNSYQNVAKFYGEPANSLDVIYIGPSGAFVSWCAPLVWEKYGVTSWCIGSNEQPLSAARYLIEETRKNHPNAVYVVSLYQFSLLGADVGIHNLVDCMPMSVTRLKMTYALATTAEFSGLENSLEYYIPLIRYHSRWNELTIEDFGYPKNNYKSANARASLGQITDVADELVPTADRLELDERNLKVVEDLLLYCRDERLPVLFVFTPAFSASAPWNARKNTVIDVCSAYGYEVMDLTELRDEVGLDGRCDFYNGTHTNVHGAVKVTNYMARYLVEHYDLEDKRGREEYSSWDKAYQDYTEVVSPYVLDVEWTGDTLDSQLSAPVLTEAAVEGNFVRVAWEAVEGADGYRVYRKHKNEAWRAVGETDAQTLQYTEICDVPGDYAYTVISFRRMDGAVRWGCYDYQGIQAAV